MLVYGDEPIGDGAIADVLLGGASPSDPPLAADESWIPEAWREDDSDG